MGSRYQPDIDPLFLISDFRFPNFGVLRISASRNRPCQRLIESCLSGPVLRFGYFPLLPLEFELKQFFFERLQQQRT